MLVDIALDASDMLMVQRDSAGKTTISLPLEVIARAYASYMANKAHFDTATETQRRVQ